MKTRAERAETCAPASRCACSVCEEASRPKRDQFSCAAAPAAGGVSNKWPLHKAPFDIRARCVPSKSFCPCEVCAVSRAPATVIIVLFRDSFGAAFCAADVPPTPSTSTLNLRYLLFGCGMSVERYTAKKPSSSSSSSSSPPVYTREKTTITNRS
ncbi:unnamed protein product [Trichogramma brassicae]|uniref:Uncharacterized protein n=1 Tax=Trichogramma brassicae TaxID=86971 RepID=A0A6H5IAM4_9HYME|nr:unnamed protein product [Trichogramma brassicae]